MPEGDLCLEILSRVLWGTMQRHRSSAHDSQDNPGDLKQECMALSDLLWTLSSLQQKN